MSFLLHKLLHPHLFPKVTGQGQRHLGSEPSLRRQKTVAGSVLTSCSPLQRVTHGFVPQCKPECWRLWLRKPHHSGGAQSKDKTGEKTGKWARGENWLLAGKRES